MVLRKRANLWGSGCPILPCVLLTHSCSSFPKDKNPGPCCGILLGGYPSLIFIPLSSTFGAGLTSPWIASKLRVSTSGAIDWPAVEISILPSPSARLFPRTCSGFPPKSLPKIVMLIRAGLAFLICLVLGNLFHSSGSPKISTSPDSRLRMTVKRYLRSVRSTPAFGTRNRSVPLQISICLG